MSRNANHPMARYLRLAAAGGVLGCILLFLWNVHQHRAPDDQRPDTSRPVMRQASPRNAAPGVHYVGDAVCQGCHQRLTASYHQHPMGQSLRRVSASGPLTQVAEGRASFDVDGLHFEVERHDGHMIHTASVRAANGQAIARSAAEISFVIGAGKRGYSYLTEQNGFLYQSPLTWYADRHAWALSPHLANARGSLERPVTVACLFCHANYVQPVAGTDNRYEQPLFQQLTQRASTTRSSSAKAASPHSSDGLAIGCERCHGPGELHVRQAQAGDLTAVAETIVNPARLPPGLRDAVCQQCHLKGVARVLRRGRQPFDYRPGLRLSDSWAVFVQPFDATGGSKFSSHFEQMNASRCFQASRGRLGCISCHDPHELPPAEKKVSYYRERCLACHGEASCTLPLAQRLQTHPADSCIACHMPHRPNSNIAHMVSTDHRILRRPEEKGGNTPSLDHLPADGINLILFHEGPGQSSEASFARDRGVALMDLANLSSSDRTRRHLAVAARRWLEPIVRDDPDDVAAQQALGSALWLMGRPDAAWAAFSTALAREPEREETLMYAAGLRAQMHHPDETLALWERVRRVNPLSVSAAVEIAQIDMQRGDWTNARAACDAALRLDPFQDRARRLLIHCSLRAGHADEARAECDKLLRIRPSQEKAIRAWFAREQGARP